MYKIIILYVFLFNGFVSGKIGSGDYNLYKILPENLEQVKLLQELQRSDYRYDFWTDPSPSTKSVDVLTSSPGAKNDLESFLSKNGIKSELATTTLQEALNGQIVNNYTKHNTESMSWDAYYNLEDIYAWLDDLVSDYPNILTYITVGTSYEGREIKGVKLSHGSGRRIIFLEGGIHSREWISPATVNYILNELLTSSDPETRAAAEDFDWYIFPVTNPDGYYWTHAPNGNRMWRKNRRPVTAGGISAIGVDLNRNWNNNWLLKGASTDPRTDIYAGPGPFSEPESRSLSQYIRSIGDQIELYLSFHSFSQLLLIPFGNTTEPVANYHDAVNIGRRAMGALAVRYGTIYITGNVAEAIYEATGGSIDWVKEHVQVPLVYCYELRDRGQYGFLLPADQILPNNEEALDSVIELIHQAKRIGYLNGGSRLPSSLVTIALTLTMYFLYN